MHWFSTDQKLFERFLETVFRVSGVDRVSLFERILPLDTESEDKLVGDTFLPFDTESVYEKTVGDSDSFEILKI